ncbi:MAG: glucose-1-phosphate cytidylyltransferase [Bacilli bacterium]
MKIVILAGGIGSRISEESAHRPKPMIEIGDRPILWHIMKIYSHYGFNDFLICLGYKGYYIKEYFEHYFLHASDITFDFTADNAKIIHRHAVEPWKVTLVDTGMETQTGGRLLRAKHFLQSDPFMVTYGDGVADVNIADLLRFHRAHGRMVTVTAAQPRARFGALHFDEGNRVVAFQEKPRGDGGWVSAGYFVMEPAVFNYIESDSTLLEQEPLENLARDGQLMAYKHAGFWQPMDTLRDKKLLDSLWNEGRAEWKVWN